MSFSKIFKTAAFVTEKLRLWTDTHFTNFIILGTKDKPSTPFSISKTISNTLLASATVLGFSLFLSHKNKISCENDDISSEIKQIKINNDFKSNHDEAINKSRDLLQRIKDEVGAPGIVVGVSINGKTVWEEGLGYADLENRVFCSKETVMRIASISKSITMAAVAKLWEEGKLDLDKHIQEYVPYFPSKSFDGQPVTITCRQLVSHLGGIRHYDKNISIGPKNTEENGRAKKKKKVENNVPEFEFKEYYIKEKYNDVKSSLELFKDDPLVLKPGTKFYYSTHGWTLISAIVEAAAQEQFSKHMIKMFQKLGMMHTYLDLNDVLIYNRSRNYIKNKNGNLINAPYVDNSYKWAGGGFLSTVGDMLHFANAMLYSLQFKQESIKTSEKIKTPNKNISSNNGSSALGPISENCTKCDTAEWKALPGYLDSKTVQVMWSPVTHSKEAKYAMGWQIIPEKQDCQFCEKRRLCIYHTGGAIGASSVLLILPKEQDLNDSSSGEWSHAPNGIVVAILANLQSVNLSKIALKIAKMFEDQS